MKTIYLILQLDITLIALAVRGDYLTCIYLLIIFVLIRTKIFNSSHIFSPITELLNLHNLRVQYCNRYKLWKNLVDKLNVSVISLIHSLFNYKFCVLQKGRKYWAKIKFDIWQILFKWLGKKKEILTCHYLIVLYIVFP